MKIFILIITTTFILVSTGCMSLEARGKGTQAGLYPGIKVGTEYNKGAAKATGLGSALGPAIVTIDRPFSFALDTPLCPSTSSAPSLAARRTSPPNLKRRNPNPRRNRSANGATAY